MGCVSFELLTVCPKYHRELGQMQARLEKLESAGWNFGGESNEGQ
jgi:hypothetical protein